MSEQTNLNRDIIQSRLEGAKGLKYWRSLDELAATDGFKDYLHREFPRQAGEWLDDDGRRNFLKIMGASLALAGLSACTKQPPEFIMPYVQEPEKLLIGKPLFYATAFPISGIAHPILVETHEFRPTKVEGNPQHPASQGSTDVPTQASILGLYDPDRLQGPTYIGDSRSYASFLSAFLQSVEGQKGKQGAGIRILTETVTSPTLGAQLQEVLKQYPEAKWYQWEATGHGRRMGAQLAFGQALNPVYKFDQADVIFSVDANFLGAGPGGVRHARDFASRRGLREGVETSRYYAIETTPTHTGCKADHRVAVKPSELLSFVRSVASAVSGGAATGSKFQQALVKDLLAAKGKSIVIAGEDVSPEVHAAVHYLNQLLDNNGKTVLFTPSLEQRPADQWSELQTLTQELNAGQVDLLIVLGGNPVYAAPTQFNLRGAFQRAKIRVRLGQYDDETSEVCQWVIPEAHTFEQWSDAPSHDGTISIIQPLITPLYGGRSAHELLNAFSETPERSGHQTVREYWASKHTGADFEAWWKRAIHDGFVKDSAPAPVAAVAKQPAASTAPVGSGIEVSFHADPYILDGRFSNNAWLQELPRPITRLTWDNAVLISPKTAKELDVTNEDVVEIAVNGSAVQGAVWVLPGQPDGSIDVTLGFGRKRSGRAGNGAGFDAFRIRSASNPYFATSAKITKKGETFKLAAVQEHFAMEGRAPVKGASVEELKANPFVIQKESETPPKGLTMYPQEWEYKGYAWGMAIDLTTCIGCNACTVACQAENNIAVVGKEQVIAGREMHWIRIDRYYSGSENDPTMHFQPVGCQHCENAPCEIVCPVAATEHDQEGLNNMVYNRCVGTRYCSNNCPYKVRRFNFMLYTDWDTESLKLQRNPDVTVRSRGVMEKCTFCVQRINYAKIMAEKEDRRVKDGEIVTACAAACPSQAIAFGDLNDPNSMVSKWKAQKTNYSLLGELNTRPRVTYLADIRNPNPELEAGREG
ncbi:MAG: 4Fe-4S ferredoxin, iron-sulfur binding domain protein [Bryobacterales bacterium]|nr:4Fe-4S ferredoxin, iron-sulfur binding domain protein [Bryobacterales bacterium]